MEFSSPKIKRALAFSQRKLFLYFANETFKKIFLYFRRELFELKNLKSHFKKIILFSEMEISISTIKKAFLIYQEGICNFFF